MGLLSILDGQIWGARRCPFATSIRTNSMVLVTSVSFAHKRYNTKDWDICKVRDIGIDRLEPYNALQSL